MSVLSCWARQKLTWCAGGQNRFLHNSLLGAFNEFHGSPEQTARDNNNNGIIVVPWVGLQDLKNICPVSSAYHTI